MPYTSSPFFSVAFFLSWNLICTWNCSFYCFMALVTYKGNLVVFSRILPRALFPFCDVLGDCIQTHGPAHINTTVVDNDRCLDPPFLERILWLHLQLPIGHSYPWKSDTSMGKKQKERNKKKKKACSWQWYESTEEGYPTLPGGVGRFQEARILTVSNRSQPKR